MRIEVQHNFGDLAKQLDAMREDLRNKAIPRALNKVVEGAKGRMATEVSAEYRITKRDVKDRLGVTRATAKAGKFYFSASLYAEHGRRGAYTREGFNLIRFVVGPGKTAAHTGGRNKRQLTIQIKRSGGAKTIPGMFIATANTKVGKGRATFIRLSKQRKDLKAMTTIDVPQMFNARKVNKRVREYINQRMPIVLQQEINFVTRKRK